MTDVLIRLATPGEYPAVGDLCEAAYSHDYEISDRYRQSCAMSPRRPTPDSRRVGRIWVHGSAWHAVGQGVTARFGPDVCDRTTAP
jgi:hypothetical protein